MKIWYAILMSESAQLDLQLMEYFNERQRRLFAATQALKYGYGGISHVHRELGLDFKTIRQGIKDLQTPLLNNMRIRKAGGGRKQKLLLQPTIETMVKEIIKPAGSPVKRITWTHLSIDTITAKVQQAGYQIGKNIINRLLWKLGYSLQVNKKALHKKSHKDRDKQFRYIDRLANGFIKSGNPVNSIDAKKTEKVGNFKNNGKVYAKKGEAIQVEDHDFGKTKAIPFGIYDIQQNTGFVNVGMDHNTAEFAVASLRKWWNLEGKYLYKEAKHVMLTADSGSSNSNRSHQFLWELQQLANKIELVIHVCHFPAGTSKWNKIEHRLFSYISHNWQGIPLVSYDVILGLIGGTTTKTGLAVRAELDRGTYELHKIPSKEQMKQVDIRRHKFHPEWNYSIYPNKEVILG